MKRFLLFFVAALLFVACDNKFEDEGNTIQRVSNLPTLTAEFAEDATRTYVEDNFYLRWHADDRLTIFYGNTLNHQYKFTGKTGANSGEFEPVKSGNLSTGNSFDHTYAFYPYNATINLDDIDKSISFTLPAEQEYTEQTFGKGANTMIAVTESVDDTFLSFKNVCGYLKVKLYGEGMVKSITIKGNNGEKIAGGAIVTMAYGDVPQLTMATGATNSITLDCGEGVALSADAEKPTEFWFVVPPTTFKNGLTITATDAYGSVFEQSTTNEVVVARNEIQPMATLQPLFYGDSGNEDIPNNEIWYTTSDGEIDVLNRTDGFGANIVSNTYENGKGVITFDGNVTTIGVSAFANCVRLTCITIPNSVTAIGANAFWNCPSIQEFNGKFASDDGRCLIVDGVLNSFANGCGATEYTIPSSVKTIGKDAFFRCLSITSITIPNSVTTIGEGAFMDCEDLWSITIPNSVTSIGSGAFYGCYDLSSITIPDSVTTIGSEAFHSCESLRSIVIGNSVTSIGDYTFMDCERLRNATIGDSVTSIGSGVFYGCYDLSSITIPDSVTAIGANAFYNCYDLTGVTIGNSVTTIGNNAFNYCQKLTSLTIPDSVTTIGDGAFSACTSLTSIAIPDSVTTIGSDAFSACTSLTSIAIPDSVTTIGSDAFAWCDSLTSVFCKATTPPTAAYIHFSWGAFDRNASGRKIYVPKGCGEVYKSAEGWSDYADDIVEYDF